MPLSSASSRMKRFVPVFCFPVRDLDHRSSDFYPSGCHSRTDPAHREFRWYVRGSNSCTPRSHRIHAKAGTMFELVKALNDGAETLKKQASNPISLNAGCELFITFVTLFPHDSDVCPPFRCISLYNPTSVEFHKFEKGAYPTRTNLCCRSTHLS